MKKLFFLAIASMAFSMLLQEKTFAQIAASISDYSPKDQKLLKEFCPTCTDGVLITDEKGNCCCVKKDGSQNCGKPTINEPLPEIERIQQLGIGAVDPCDDQANCMIFGKLKNLKIPFNRVIVVTPAMKKYLIKNGIK